MNSLKLYLLYFYFLLYSCSSFAAPDSLLQVLHDGTYAIEEEAELYHAIGKSYFDEMDNKNAFVYLKEGLKKAKLQENQLLTLECTYLLGRYQYRNQAYSKALELFKEAKEVAKEDFPKKTASVYHEISKTYVALGNNELAYDYQYRSLELSEAIQDSAGIVVALYEIGTVFFYQEHYQLALENYKKALVSAESMNHAKFIYSCLAGIGSAYHRLGEFEKSIPYNLRSLKLSEEIDYELGIAYATSNVGSDYFALEQYGKALNYLLKSLEIQRKLGDRWGALTNLRMLGEVYMYLEDKRKSLKYAEEALALAEEIDARPRILESYKSLSKIHEYRKEYNKANVYLKQFIILKDSLVNATTTEQMASVKRSYEISQRDKALIEKDVRIMNMNRYIFGVGFLVCIIIIWLLYSKYRNQFEHSQLLENKNTQIESQNEQLINANEVQRQSNRILLQKNTQIKQQNSKLKQSNEELQRFAFIASHDLKEPLRNIGSYASLLKRRYSSKLDEDAGEFMTFITDGVSRMYVLLNEVLSYSKLGNEEEELDWVDMNRIGESVQNSLHQQITNKKAYVNIGILPSVKASDTHITQLLQNLISNGIKYSNNEKPIVRVEVERTIDRYVFSVKDNGIGIDMAYKDKVFEIFQRLHGKNEYEGTGIGLAICKKIVQQYGGDIWVESTLGEGSSFYFSFPYHIVAEKAAVA